MYKILHKEILKNDINKLMIVEAPAVAKKTRAGQFIILRVDEQGERIPLTVADYDREAGTVTIVFQEVGKTTMHLGTLEPGDDLATFVGPLGHPTEIENYGKVICVGGGTSIAIIFPIARALKKAGNHVISIIGARTENLLFWEERMREVSDELIVCTDDGSHGRKGLVTAPLKELLDEHGKGIAHIWAIGPPMMMKFVALTTEPYETPTTVSLNTIMIDGTGMCGGCRVLLEDGAKFVCVDGPEFDGHKVDWDNMLARLQFYRPEEQASVGRWEHKCELDGVLAKGGASV